MGVMLLIFTPVPYMDATSSWSFRSRGQRMLVGGAGMIVEVFVAALATFVWANTGQGAVHSLAYNMMFVASVSTVIFNINPLLRFDGYYMLSDFLDIPNLHQRAQKQLHYLTERYAFGVRKADSPAQTGREAAWLTVFGISSAIYRVIVFAGILLFVADRFLLLGILMAAICLVSWIFVPITKLVTYLASSPRLERQRFRAVAVTAGFFAVLLVFLQYVPMPNHFRAPGILESRQWAQIFNESPGLVESVQVQSGARVTQGQPLMQLRNQEIDLELTAARASLDEIDARLRHAMQEATANLKPLNSRLESVKLRLQLLEKDRDALVIRAPQDGIWVAPRLEDYNGRWLARGTELGLVVDPAAFQFVATVAQEDGDTLFSKKISGAEIRLYGQSGEVVPVEKFKVMPAEKRNLPSAALGWAAGGDIAVQSDDPQGLQAQEPFFEVEADVASAPAALLHGRGGRIRFQLEAEPLLPRWIRRLRQLLQKRYQL
jgi:putative peptide zinc metalloprotease protein